MTFPCRTKLSLSHALSQSVKISLVRGSLSYLLWSSSEPRCIVRGADLEHHRRNQEHTRDNIRNWENRREYLPIHTSPFTYEWYFADAPRWNHAANRTIVYITDEYQPRRLCVRFACVFNSVIFYLGVTDLCLKKGIILGEIIMRLVAPTIRQLKAIIRVYLTFNHYTTLREATSRSHNASIYSTRALRFVAPLHFLGFVTYTHRRSFKTCLTYSKSRWQVSTRSDWSRLSSLLSRLRYVRPHFLLLLSSEPCTSSHHYMVSQYLELSPYS